MRARQHRLKHAAQGAAVAALTGVLALLLPWPGASLSRLSFDLSFLLTTPRTPEEAVVVYLDDVSHQQLDQRHGSPWDRRLHAQLITNLLAQGARVVALDIVFNEPGNNPSADVDLARAVQAGGRKVVLAALLDESVPGIRRLELPRPELRNPTNDNWGVANLWEDSDGVIRRHFQFDPEWPDLRSLSWRVATCYQPALEATLNPRDARSLIRYYGPPGTLARLSYFEAINPTNHAVALLVRGRAVFVGAGSAVGYTGELKESVPTPYSRLQGVRGPKLDIHATQFVNLVRADGLVRPSGIAELLMVVASGGLIGLVLGILGGSDSRLPVIAAVLIGLLAVLGAQATLHGRTCWPWAVAVLVQVPVAIAWALATARSRRSVGPAAGEPTAEFKPAARWEGAMNPPIPAVPDHELIRCIGQGSYGEVWLARAATGAFRAIKTVRRRVSGEDRQFDREFAGLQRVEPISRLHEGLVDILHVGRNRGTAGDFLYYVMELADDEATLGGPAIDPERYQPRTLRALLDRGGRVSWDECLRVGIRLAAALDFLHSRGLVHRDIKPGNIIFIEGQPRLADIGLIAGVNEQSSLVGTAGYLPPEGPGTCRADLFSLGMVLYELTTGLPHGRFPELPVETAGPAGPKLDGLINLIFRLCAHSPEQRPASAAAVHEALQRLNGSPDRTRVNAPADAKKKLLG